MDMQNIGYYLYMQQQSEDFIYQQTENGIQVILYNGNLYDVTIPEFIEGEPVTSLSDILFQHNETVRSVYLPDTITRIPNPAHLSRACSAWVISLPLWATASAKTATTWVPPISPILLPAMLWQSPAKRSSARWSSG